MRHALLILGLIVAIVTPGTETHGSRATPQVPSAIQSAFSLEGTNSSIKGLKTVVARDAKSFAGLWNLHAPGSKPPSVDFRKHDVIAVFAGEKRTGGHSVRIDGIRRTRTKAVIAVTFVTPAPDMMVTMALTYPWAMRAVPKLPPTVSFECKTAPMSFRKR